jgi:hypothetical protein
VDVHAKSARKEQGRAALTPETKKAGIEKAKPPPVAIGVKILPTAVAAYQK